MLVSVEATKLQIFEAISESEPAKHVALVNLLYMSYSRLLQLTTESPLKLHTMGRWPCGNYLIVLAHQDYLEHLFFFFLFRSLENCSYKR